MGGQVDIRPWGMFEVLFESRLTKVKRIVVDPGRRLSYQFHRHRAEHWTIVAGRAVVVLDGREHRLGPGGSIAIPLGAAHRIENPGPETVEFIEVQTGDSFDEGDIVRIEDDFGRT